MIMPERPRESRNKHTSSSSPCPKSRHTYSSSQEHALRCCVDVNTAALRTIRAEGGLYWRLSLSREAGLTFWLCFVLSAAGRHAQATAEHTHTRTGFFVADRHPRYIFRFKQGPLQHTLLYDFGEQYSARSNTGNTPCADALRSAVVLISPSATAIHRLVDVRGQVALNAGASQERTQRPDARNNLQTASCVDERSAFRVCIEARR